MSTLPTEQTIVEAFSTPPEYLCTASSALLIHECLQGLAILRRKLLQELVYPQTAISNPHQKPYCSYRRLIENEDAYSILAAIWKESGFVTDTDLRSAGMSRVYSNNDLTAHRLAVDTASSPKEVGALNNWIGNLVEAATAYGLVEIFQERKTRKHIQGTALLHRYMVAYAIQGEILFPIAQPDPRI